MVCGRNRDAGFMGGIITYPVIPKPGVSAAVANGFAVVHCSMGKALPLLWLTGKNVCGACQTLFLFREPDPGDRGRETSGSFPEEGTAMVLSCF